MKRSEVCKLIMRHFEPFTDVGLKTISYELSKVKGIETIFEEDWNLPPNPMKRPHCPSTGLHDATLFQYEHRKAFAEYLEFWQPVPTNLSRRSYTVLADYIETKVYGAPQIAQPEESPQNNHNQDSNNN